MTLREQQSLFMKLLPRLIDYAFAQGYELVGKELERTQAQATANAATKVGIEHSLHLLCLAIDVALFKNGVYLTDSAAYEFMGNYWKSLHELARWGGDFKAADGVTPKPDGNHFSLEWNGVK